MTCLCTPSTEYFMEDGFPFNHLNHKCTIHAFKVSEATRHVPKKVKRYTELYKIEFIKENIYLTNFNLQKLYFNKFKSYLQKRHIIEVRLLVENPEVKEQKRLGRFLTTHHRRFIHNRSNYKAADIRILFYHKYGFYTSTYAIYRILSL